MSYTNEIRAFIVDRFLFGQAGDLTETDSLLDKGIIDSTGALELVGFLEDTWGITVDDSELVPENLDSIANISAFVTRKKG